MTKCAALVYVATLYCSCICFNLAMDDIALEDGINSLIEGDADLQRDLKFQSLPSYFSGENVLNDTNPELIADMMFQEHENRATTVSPSNLATETSINGSQRIADALLKSLEHVLESYNASILIDNRSLVVRAKTAMNKNIVVLQIQGDILIQVNDISKAFPSLTNSDKTKIDGLIEQYNKSLSATNVTKSVYVCEVTSLEAMEIDEIRQLVSDGYLDEQSLTDVENAKISVEDALTPLLKNKEFVLAQFPDKVSEMLEENRVPSYIEDVMFTGTQSLDELKRMVYYDDVVSKAMLPDRLRSLLEDRPPTIELKEFLYCGLNHSTMIGLTMKNNTMIESLMSESMFYFFNLFRVQRNVVLNMAMSATTIVALTCVMTSLGCTMTIKEILVHVKRPKGVLIALVSQYGVMPAAAFGLTQLFGLGVYPAIAVLICGCCPGGNLSNILAFAINGDMNLSILMTTCSSVLGLATMPLLLFCYSRFIIPVDSAEIVPFSKIILNIVLTILPVSIGIAIKHYRPTWTKTVMRFGAIMLLLCSITFSIMAGFLLGDKFFSYFPTSVVYCAAILPVTGYVLGFVLARLVRENQKCSRTISVETGCQNVQLCGTVLKLAFDPVLIGAMMLLPIIYMLFQAGEAILLITIYRLYERFCGKKKADDQDDEIKFDDEDKKFERSDSVKKEQDDEKIAPTMNNGKGTNKNSKDMTSSDGENWPLVPSQLEVAFEKSKENYV